MVGETCLGFSDSKVSEDEDYERWKVSRDVRHAFARSLFVTASWVPTEIWNLYKRKNFLDHILLDFAY